MVSNRMGQHTKNSDAREPAYHTPTTNITRGNVAIVFGSALNTVHMLQHSVLIPNEDLRVTRASLPEFTGTRVEDPVRFLKNTESILTQANIHPSGWTKAVETLMKRSDLTWWKFIKVLNLSWLKFWTEFLENCDNPEIQTQLSVSVVSPDRYLRSR